MTCTFFPPHPLVRIQEIHPIDPLYKIRLSFLYAVWPLVRFAELGSGYSSLTVQGPSGKEWDFSRVKFEIIWIPDSLHIVPDPTVTVWDWYVERAKACSIFRVNGLTEEALKAKFTSRDGLTFQRIDGTERERPATDPTTDIPEVHYPYFD